MMPGRCPHHKGKRPLVDARDIFVTYVCDDCEEEKRKRFRPEIFSDPNYDTFGEEVEGDFFDE